MEFHGNVTECGDVGVGPGRSFLFLLTAYDPGWINQRWGFMAGRATLYGLSGAPTTVLENPQEGFTFMPSRTDNRSRSPRLTASS
jgi:hypothetical protein